MPGLTWHAFSEHAFQIRQHAKLRKKNGAAAVRVPTQHVWNQVHPLRARGACLPYTLLPQVIVAGLSAPPLENVPVGGPVRYSQGQVRRREKSSAVSMGENTSCGCMAPKWEPPSLSPLLWKGHCTKEDLLLQRQERCCLSAWTVRQALFKGQGLSFSISSLFPSACLASYFLLSPLFFSTAALVQYINNFRSIRQHAQSPFESSSEITHCP